MHRNFLESIFYHQKVDPLIKKSDKKLTQKVKILSLKSCHQKMSKKCQKKCQKSAKKVSKNGVKNVSKKCQFWVPEKCQKVSKSAIFKKCQKIGITLCQKQAISRET